MRIPLSKPVFNDEMKEAAIDALQNEFFVLGESVYKFEEEFARYTGSKYAVSVNSGTAALSLSLQAMGINKGDRILTTSTSFVATSNAIIHAGGVPVFSDINPTTGGIELHSLGDIKNIRGIIPVHLYGNPVKMDEILKLKEKNNIFVIEDSCQAHGARHNGKMVGTFGDVGAFSFYSTKNMTVAGDGGMIVTDNEEIAEKIKVLRNCGREKGKKYTHSMIGYTARLNTVNAAIGRVQLRHLDEWNERRRHIASLYRRYLPENMVLKDNDYNVYHLFVIKSHKRDKIAERLGKEGIQTAIHYPIPIPLQKIYRELFGYHEGMFPQAEKFSKEILSIPMFPELKDDEVRHICEIINEVIE